MVPQKQNKKRLFIKIYFDMVICLPIIYLI